MDFVAKHISELEESLTLSITSQANQMKADGEDICSFGAGEPDL
ncbi:MAG: aspartate aminotransferase, partial [Verrucomicrobiales bacterium]